MGRNSAYVYNIQLMAKAFGSNGSFEKPPGLALAVVGRRPCGFITGAE